MGWVYRLNRPLPKQPARQGSVVRGSS
ncbi:hypothetical protein CCACVL1_30345, partial [Corchorus capsularis]